MKTFAFVMLMLFACPTFACDSYEDCMKGEPRWWVQDGKGPRETMFVPNEKHYLKAIAYKLDEISKKLDAGQPREPYEAVVVAAKKMLRHITESHLCTENAPEQLRQALNNALPQRIEGETILETQK